ncbi:PadR family transcriptional regulator [Acuticoccus sp. 2012]|uniref:PadR family transcriptional regulator n=1 Tax=Acuticoccus mangrovi TaxID=2796142 RepID=A0A934IP41_9HYPH|nr:PadR family transcriptional regulator [Acuticoccus mangrovi]
MSTLCLAILQCGEATGYEIKKESVEGDYRYFVDASYGSIYPALARLANDGYVTVREETHPGRPIRKIYSITPEGTDALIAALSQPPGPDQRRSRFLLVAKSAPHLPAAVVKAAVDERRRLLTEEMEHLRRITADYSDEPSVAWIVGYGLACMGTSLDYLEKNADDLVAIAKPPLADAAE